MRKTRKFLLGLDRSEASLATGSQVVHVVSRAAGQEILFEDEDKETFQKILFMQLKFSGLRVIAWCFMGNHFHLLLEIPDREAALDCLGEEELIGRLSCFSKEYSTKLLLGEIDDCRRSGDVAGLSRIAEKVGKRLFDLSVFMKELKLRMTLAFNYSRGRKGTLWAGRFKNLVVAGDEAIRVVAAYIDLNPIRAGLVKKPEDYPWCSYGAAVGGLRLARSGLVSAVSYENKIPWMQALDHYRKFMYGIEPEVKGEVTADVYEKARRGFSRRKIEAVLAEGGKLTLAQALRCRVRYFTAGGVLGSQASVDDFFNGQKESFGEKRTSGGRRMKGAEWGDLRVLRQLRDDVVVLPDLV